MTKAQHEQMKRLAELRLKALRDDAQKLHGFGYARDDNRSELDIVQQQCAEAKGRAEGFQEACVELLDFARRTTKRKKGEV